MFEVDIIIPFHREIDDFLLEAIASAEQSEGIIPRVILVNDTPRNLDATYFLQQRGYDVLSSSGGGFSECLNLAVQFSSSQFVAQLNSDDLHHPKRLLRQIELMLDLESDLSITRLNKFGGNRSHFELSGKQPRFFFDKSLLLLGSYGANSSAVFKRNFLRGKSWESTKMADWKFAFDNYPTNVAYLDEPLYYYRMHPKQVSRIDSSTPDWLEKSWRLEIVKILDTDVIASNALIKAIALPGKLPNLHERDFVQIYQIFELLLMKCKDENELYQKDFAALLIRRLLIAAANNRRWQEVIRFSQLFGKIPFAQEILRIAMEFSLYSRVARR
jgi:glycosyltransferase involved in cell wall biosynthesis